jgi:hypothetical protein
MITMINERNGHKAMFKNYQKLFDHIDHNQRMKRYNKSHQPIDDWFLGRHSYRRVMAFYEFVSVQKINAERTSGDQPPKFDVLEMSHDRSRKPVIIPITSDLDVEQLLEAWCQRYCDSNGYKLVEIQDDDGILHVKKTQHYPSIQW